MPVNARNEKVTEEGESRDALVVTFTNGAREQVKELQQYFDQASEVELVKLGISLLLNIKQNDEKNKGKD